MKRLMMVFLMMMVGCITKDGGTYVEGTETAVGLFVPYNGTIYGIQALHYLNGTIINAKSNCPPMKITRTHNSTNSYFGVVRTVENTKTEIEIKAR